MVTILDTVNPKFNGLNIYICMFILNLLNTL